MVSLYMFYCSIMLLICYQTVITMISYCVHCDTTADALRYDCCATIGMFQDTPYLIQDTSGRVQDIGMMIQDTRYTLQDIKYKIQDIRCFLHHTTLQDTV